MQLVGASDRRQSLIKNAQFRDVLLWCWFKGKFPSIQSHSHPELIAPARRNRLPPSCSARPLGLSQCCCCTFQLEEPHQTTCLHPCAMKPTGSITAQHRHFLAWTSKSLDVGKDRGKQHREEETDILMYKVLKFSVLRAFFIVALKIFMTPDLSFFTCYLYLYLPS